MRIKMLLFSLFLAADFVHGTRFDDFPDRRLLEEETTPTKRYRVAPNKMTRPEGLTWCADQGMDLVAPRSDEDIAEIQNLGLTHFIWLAIERDESNPSRWINTHSQEPVTYTNWNGAEGNNRGERFAIMRFDSGFSGRWFDWGNKDLKYDIVCDSEQIPNDIPCDICVAHLGRDCGLVQNGRIFISEILPQGCDACSEELDKYCANKLEEVQNVGDQCIKHADRGPFEMEIGSCCGLPGEITCGLGYVLEAPVPDVCGGSCPKNWCNHRGVLKNARDYRCVPERQNIPCDICVAHLGRDCSLMQTGIPASEILPRGCDACGEEAEKYCEDKLNEAQNVGDQCIKHADRGPFEMEIGSCCGLPGEITCGPGYVLEAPVPDVCGGSCPKNWCNHHGVLKNARDYRCVPEQQNIPCDICVAHLGRDCHFIHTGIPASEILPPGCDACGEEAEKYCADKLDEAHNVGDQCIKHADQGPFGMEIGSCCGLPGEITCGPGYVLEAPVPVVCGGSCPKNWCNHHGVLKNARDYRCVPEPQNIPCDICVAHLGRDCGLMQTGIPASEILPPGCDACGEEAEKYCADKLDEAQNVGDQCIKHADRGPFEMEIGSCCGLAGEITCGPGYVLEAPVPDVCGGSCPKNWCNHRGVLKNARDYRCVPEQKIGLNGEEFCEGPEMIRDEERCRSSSCCHWNTWEEGEASFHGQGRCWSDIGTKICQDTGSPDVNRCSPYSAEQCRIAAEALGLTPGGKGYAFEGNYRQKGCYAYTSGKYAGRAYYGLGGTDAEIRHPVPFRPNTYRPVGWDCKDSRNL